MNSRCVNLNVVRLIKSSQDCHPIQREAYGQTYTQMNAGMYLLCTLIQINSPLPQMPNADENQL